MLIEALVQYRKTDKKEVQLKEANKKVSSDIVDKYGTKCKVSARYFAKSEISLLIVIGERFIDTITPAELINEYLNGMELKGHLLNLNEISSRDFYNRMLNTRDTVPFQKMTEEYFEIEHTYEEWGRFTFVGQLDCIDEFLVSQTEKFDIGLYRSKIDRELEKIKQNKNKGFIGHPVHYLVKDHDVRTTKDVVQYMVRELNNNKRLASFRVADLNHVNRRNAFTTVDIQYAMRATKGSSMIIDLRPCVFEHSSFAELNAHLTDLAKQIKKYSQSILFFLIYDDENDFSIKKVLEDLADLRFIELDEELMNYDAAMVYLKEIVEKNNFSYEQFEEVIPSGQILFTEEDVTKAFLNRLNELMSSELFPEYSGVEKRTFVSADNAEGKAYKELQELIGLENIKELIDKFIAYNKAIPELTKLRIKTDGQSRHMVFTGNPGTAKTTVARLLGRIMKDNGLLSVGGFFEAGRADIIGEYVGWTSVKVRNLFKKAKGSVLFIDEAYAIFDDNKRSFAYEAVAAIVQEMENMRDDIVVIFAGYPKEMTDFINQNPGLKSRIGFTVDFNDYSIDELVEIAEKLINDAGYKIEKDALFLIEDICENALDETNFGNGRFVRNLVEKIILRHVYQIKSWENISKEEAITIKVSDIEVETFPYSNSFTDEKGMCLLN